MKLIEQSFQTPAENLAFDEALLDYAESHPDCVLLRFWESQAPFIVLGYSNHYKTEVNVDALSNSPIPVLRRTSGGGTVLQGPGCLSYSLILKISSNPNLASITNANCWIMKRNANALQNLTPETINIQGHTDLTLNDLKFSGNAQRRKKTHLLFHGTILFNAELNLISTYLRMPSKQPDYRNSRTHEKFLINFPSKPDQIIEVMQKEWAATEGRIDLQEETAKLIEEKYGSDLWNLKY